MRNKFLNCLAFLAYFLTLNAIFIIGIASLCATYLTNEVIINQQHPLVSSIHVGLNFLRIIAKRNIDAFETYLAWHLQMLIRHTSTLVKKLTSK